MGHDKLHSGDHTHGQPDAISPANIGQYGVAPLDVNSKVAVGNLPDAIVGAMKYIGTWDASGGVFPTVPTPSKGDYHVISVAGTMGGVDYVVGDWLVCNNATGPVWAKIDNSDKVSSVNGETGPVVLDAGDVGAEPSGAIAIHAGLPSAHHTRYTDSEALAVIKGIGPNRIIHVDKSGFDTQSGSSMYPLLTIGAAITKAKTMFPSYASPIAIVIGPGIYAEQVIIEVSGISMYGYGQGQTRIERNGTALIVRDNGIDSPPLDFKTVGISIKSTNALEYSIDIIGIAGTNLGGNELQFRDGRAEGTLSVRSNICNCIDFQNFYIIGKQLYQQTSGIWHEDSESNDEITVDWNNAGIKPIDTSHYGINFTGHWPKGNIVILNSGIVGEDYRARKLGTATGTVCQGNDSRLSDARTPVAHNQGADTITSGILDGDRLPAFSTTKKAGVPATGSPTGKYLKDDGTWAIVPGGVDTTAIHKAVASEISVMTEKTSPVIADLVVIEDSADIYNKKKLQLGNIQFLSQFPMCVGGSTAYARNQTGYMAYHGFYTTEENARTVVSKGQITFIFIRVSFNDITDPSIVTLMKNGVATTMVITIPASTTGVFTSVNPVDVVDMDYISYRIAIGTGSVGQAISFKGGWARLKGGL